MHSPTNQNVQTRLIAAFKRGDIASVELLLEEGAQVDKSCKKALWDVVRFSRNNAIDAAKILIAHGADINQINNNRTVLCRAIKFKNHEIARYLLERGADANKAANSHAYRYTPHMNARMNKYLTYLEPCTSPLWNAVMNNDLESTQLLLDYGAEPDPDPTYIIRYANETPYTHAFIKGYQDIATLLLRKGAAQPNETDLRKLRTLGECLTKAVEHRLLSKTPKNIKDVNELISEAECGNASAVQEIIDTGIDVNLQNEVGTTALLDAAISGKKEVVELLLENGADVNTGFYNDKTTFESVIEYCNEIDNYIDILSLLVAHRADPNQANKKGETPLIIAAKTGNIELARYLLSLKVDPNREENTYGRSALMFAVFANNTELVQCLLSHKADLYLENIRKAFVYATDDSMKKLLQKHLQEHVTVSKVDEDVKESTELRKRHRVDSEAESHDTAKKAFDLLS